MKIYLNVKLKVKSRVEFLYMKTYVYLGLCLKKMINLLSCAGS
jgi:hypothetical protein